MAASNQTTNYALNQWSATDPVLRTDFNSDNSKIDAALKSLNTTVQQHTTQLSQQAAAVAQCGDCKLYSTTYVGNGSNTLSLTFPSKPLFAILYGDVYGNLLTFLVGNATTAYHNTYGGTLSWSGSTVTLTNTKTGSTAVFNSSGVTYQVVALLQAGN